MDTISKNLIRKILHEPTVRLKNSQSPQHVSLQISVLSHLFNIDSTVADLEAASANVNVPNAGWLNRNLDDFISA